MKNLQLVQQNLLASKTLVSSIEETPVISAIEVEFIPNKQKLESFFSDAMHLASTTRGKAPSSLTLGSGAKSMSSLVKRSDWKNGKDMLRWIVGLNLEEPLINFQSADVMVSSISWDSPRTYLASSLENDMKYRLGVQEFYMDRVNIRVKFQFTSSSSKHVRAREAFLRLNYLPMRLVKRLAK